MCSARPPRTSRPGSEHCVPRSPGATICSSPQEQALFRRLSVFVGGWSLEGAEAIASIDGDANTIDTVETLAGLIDHSLVEARQGASNTYWSGHRTRPWPIAANGWFARGHVPAGLRARGGFRPGGDPREGTRRVRVPMARRSAPLRPGHPRRGGATGRSGSVIGRRFRPPLPAPAPLLPARPRPSAGPDPRSSVPKRIFSMGSRSEVGAHPVPAPPGRRSPRPRLLAVRAATPPQR